MSTMQYWSNTQKMRFVSGTLGTHICVHNPADYKLMPLTKAQASIPVQPGSNLLVGGVEFAAAAVPLTWEEMDYEEYVQLGAYFYQPVTMIDMNDNGYQGWLVPVGFEWLPGVQTKVGKATMSFVVSKPGNGLLSTINTIGAGGTITASTATGGSLAPSTTLYYALTFWSNWGEGILGPVKTVTTPSTAGSYLVNLSWTAPTSTFYRKARLYISTATILPNQVNNVKAEIYTSFTQSWTDYCGLSGCTSTATTPSADSSFTGRFAGGVWINMS